MNTTKNTRLKKIDIFMDGIKPLMSVFAKWHNQEQ